MQFKSMYVPTHAICNEELQPEYHDVTEVIISLQISVLWAITCFGETTVTLMKFPAGISDELHSKM